MPSSSPSPHSTVVQPPMITIPSGSSSPHSTVVQPSSHHSPSSTSGTSAKVARGRGEGTERTAQKNGNSVFPLQEDPLAVTQLCKKIVLKIKKILAIYP
ncbi:hypothetical protein OUZ56_016809 [Daphnia magna]|uniref:Uncharacterized protein n=1 Tax=Daphnia magna TaxID=35525 RepID=A0ABR0ARL0_9CRUS|nr:hypothetical protein OUZ56_016809 [Daphnia magna]